MTEAKKDKIFKAIADSKRRAIIRMLVLATTALNINDISAHFSESRQAITKHIKTLEDSGLVTINRIGRESFCEVHPANLSVVNEWLQFYQKFWTGKLDDLGTFLDET